MIDTREQRLRRAAAARRRAARLERRRTRCSSATSTLENRLRTIESQHDVAALGTDTERDAVGARAARRGGAGRRARDRRERRAARAAGAGEGRAVLPPGRSLRRAARGRRSAACATWAWRCTRRRAAGSASSARASSMPQTPASSPTARERPARARIEALQTRLAAAEQRQSAYLAQLAVHELEQQKDRLAAYQVQARFALATMYDRAASAADAARPGRDAAPRAGADAAAGAGAAPPRRRPGAAAVSGAAARGLLAAWPAAARLRCCAARAGADAAANPPRHHRRSRQAHRVEVHPDTPASASSRAARWRTTGASSSCRTPIRKLRAEAMRRLGDLNLDAGEMQRLQQEVTAVDLQGAEAIRLYTTLLKAYPDYARNDQVLYQLARAYETTGQPDPALATLDRIVQRYPQSPQLDEVQFRRGELLFSAKRYPRGRAGLRGGDRARRRLGLLPAEPLQARLVAVQAVAHAREPAVLRRGARSRARHARRRSAVQLESLKRADRELVEDTLRVMSITFSYNDGAASLEQYLQPARRAALHWLLYSRLGDLYVDKQRYQDAASVVSRLRGARSRTAITRRTWTWRRSRPTARAASASWCSTASTSSSSTTTSTRPTGRPAAAPTTRAWSQELKTNLKDVATYFHASAQKSKSIADYQEAARWYRDYLKSFPDDADSAADQLSAGRGAVREPPVRGSRRRVRAHRLRLSAQRQVGDRGVRGAGLPTRRARRG